MGIENLPWLDSSGRLRLDPLRIVKGRLSISGPPEYFDMSLMPDRFIVPGLIDSHVHFRQPGQAYKEGIVNGCRAAIAGGVTTVLDMPNNIPPVNTHGTLRSKYRLWQKRALISWGIFICPPRDLLRSPNDIFRSPQALCRLPQALYCPPQGAEGFPFCGLKVFMSRSGACEALVDAELLSRLILMYPRIAIHAELDTPDNSHHNRPRSNIIAALKIIEKALELAEKTAGRIPDCRIIILHLSTADETDWMGSMKKRGYDLKAETCPHYLYFTDSDTAVKGAEIQVNPPIRDKADQEALWQAIWDGTIDMFSSDHAPHSPDEKNSLSPPSGIPGIERMWPLLAKAAESGRITWQHALRLGASNPAECYGMKDRGELSDGMRADLVILRRNKSGKRNGRIITRAAYDPYDNLDFPWEVDRVLLSDLKKEVYEISENR